jgi:dienelactone hydrolase
VSEIAGPSRQAAATLDNVGPPSYDPFARGAYPVGVRTIEARDAAHGRVFPCEIWYPASARRGDRPGGTGEARDAVTAEARDVRAGEARDAPARSGPRPLIIFSHHSGGHRRKATFLCAHLASHGYAVAAPDHSEVIAPELAPPGGAAGAESGAERAARIRAIIGSRVPDVRFLLDHLLGTGAAGGEFDPGRVGLAGHSFGGWTVLAAPEVEPRVRAVVALAPGGGGRPKPGILPLTLSFGWDRQVPALYLAAEDDTPVPLDGLCELFGRAPAPKRMFVLRRADHQHFVDDVEGEHEALRAMSLPGDAAWIPAAMRPVTELCSAEQAHTFTRGLALAHLDATLRRNDAAARFLAGDVEAALAARGVDAFAYPGVSP